MLNIFGSTFEIKKIDLELAAKETFLHLKKDFEINLRFVSEKRITELNRIYRKKNRPTNVLSFEIDSENPGGDVVICYKEARKDSKKWGIGLSSAAALLLIHGILHLAGFEHSSATSRDKMENIENKIMKKLGVIIER